MKNLLKYFCFILLAWTLSCTDSDRGNVTDGSRGFNEPYYGKYLSRVAFPIGGIGAGMIALEGTGAISHVSVYNKPDMFNEPCMFAALSLKGVEHGAKVLEGPVPDWKVFGRPETGNGAPRTSYGLPRFEEAEFDARFPFGKIDLRDPDIPLDVSITGWSPFIPLDPDNSSLPVGALEYRFVNTGNKEVEAMFSYNSVNFMELQLPYPQNINQQTGEKNFVKPYPNGFILGNKGTETVPGGEFAIFTDDDHTVVDHCWFRGTWYDPLTITWKHIEEAEPRVVPPVDHGAPGASLFVPFVLKPGEEKVIRLMLTWYVPNSTLRSGGSDFERLYLDDEVEGIASGDYCSNYYCPWYGKRFKSITELTSYWQTEYDDLKKRTEQFTESFYGTTLPDEVKEAVAANLTILKSPTILRQCDGTLWAWEGCKDNVGCCFGTCTHVWNYAQSIPHLFPSLERSMREAEYFHALAEDGHHTFRIGIPIRDTGHEFPSAADGQLGEIMKVYREWRIYGNEEWIRTMFPRVRLSMDYCIREWDPRETGTLEEPHHNTYDVEFWGPDGMCTSFYLGALKAVILMGEYLGEDVSRYQVLLEKGTRSMEEELYDGEYFYQKIMVEGLNSPDPIATVGKTLRSTYSEEAKVILRKEGPKYQYGKGCLSDGILGFWIAKVSGIDEPIIDENKVKSHLVAVHKYNFKKDLSDHANPQRPTFAMKNDGGLLLCSWPKGGKLSLPFVYSNEVWTGIEYQVASHLMFEGYVDEALEIVRACRKRYDGSVRNPFNEYECGHWYARAMASYGLIQGLTGIRYDAVTRTLYIDSQIGNNFDSFFSCGSGYGNVGLENGKPYVRLVAGTMDIEKCVVSGEEVPVPEVTVLNQYELKKPIPGDETTE